MGFVIILSVMLLALNFPGEIEDVSLLSRDGRKTLFLLDYV